MTLFLNRWIAGIASGLVLLGCDEEGDILRPDEATAVLDAPSYLKAGSICVSDAESILVKRRYLVGDFDYVKFVAAWFDTWHHEIGMALNDIDISAQKIGNLSVRDTNRTDNKARVAMAVADNSTVEFNIMGTSVRGKDPTCPSSMLTSQRVFYAILAEDDDRDDASGCGPTGLCPDADYEF